MLDERQPHLHRLFHHICHITGLQLAHQVVTVKFYGIVADVQLPGDDIGRMSLGYVLQDFEFSIRKVDLLDILLIDQSEKLLTIIPLSFFYPVQSSKKFLRVITFQNYGIYILVHQLTYRPDFFVHRIDNDLGLGMLMVKQLDKQQTVLITQFQVDDSGIDILPVDDIPGR